jgi:hypothetical protein
MVVGVESAVHASGVGYATEAGGRREEAARDSTKPAVGSAFGDTGTLMKEMNHGSSHGDD